MFEDYLRDATYFVWDARDRARVRDEDGARRSYRVAIIVGAASIETFVNYVASTLAEGGDAVLEQHEMALLLDRRFGQDGGVFRMSEQTVYNRLEDKLRFLIEHFKVDIDLTSDVEWSQTMELKKRRDGLIHARMEQDETKVDTYDKACVRGIQATFLLMNALSMGIFKRPLRPKLRDLVDFKNR